MLSFSIVEQGIKAMEEANLKNDSLELWERAMKICIGTMQDAAQQSMAERNFSMITSVKAEGLDFKISASNEFAVELLEGDYKAKLINALQLAGAKGDINLEFAVDESTRQKLVIAPETKNSSTKSKNSSNESVFISTIPLNPDYTFEEFVRGPSNSLANATAVSIAEKPGQRGYNPFFIYGGTGLGKTHLMQAIGNRLKKRNPKISVCYLTAEVFLNEYVSSLKNNTVPQFRERYRKVDVLLVDDIQFIARRTQTQEEFFNTYNSLTADGKQIVMTSDVPPQQLHDFEVRLISRFEGGMVQEIELPSYETRLAILRKKAESMTPKIPENALKYIAEKIKSHVRAMEGALAKIHMMSKMNPTLSLNDDVLEHLLSDLIEKEKNLKKITVEEIQNTICQRYSITMAQMLSSERSQSLVTPRQLAMYISRKYTTKSLPEIAKMFDKSHATILHGVKTITKRLDVEPELKSSMEEIISKFGYSIEDTID